MCQLSPKKPNIEKKTNIFLTPTVSTKSQICEIWREKGNLAALVSRGGLHSLFHLLTCE